MARAVLAHKCEAKAFAWALVYSPDAVDEHALSYVCGTSDLGTESKCGAFNIDDSPEKLLPPWMNRVMGLDIDDPESQEGPPVGVADAPEPSRIPPMMMMMMMIAPTPTLTTSRCPKVSQA